MKPYNGASACCQLLSKRAVVKGNSLHFLHLLTPFQQYFRHTLFSYYYYPYLTWFYSFVKFFPRHFYFFFCIIIFAFIPTFLNIPSPPPPPATPQPFFSSQNHAEGSLNFFSLQQRLYSFLALFFSSFFEFIPHFHYVCIELRAGTAAVA